MIPAGNESYGTKFTALRTYIPFLLFVIVCSPAFLRSQWILQGNGGGDSLITPGAPTYCTNLQGNINQPGSLQDEALSQKYLQLFSHVVLNSAVAFNVIITVKLVHWIHTELRRWPILHVLDSVPVLLIYLCSSPLYHRSEDDLVFLSSSEVLPVCVVFQRMRKKV